MKCFFLGGTLGGDPHTEGLFKAARIAKRAGFEAHILSPTEQEEGIRQWLLTHDPVFVGLSYRLTPAVGIRLLSDLLRRLEREGLLLRANGQPRRIAFAGLPETLRQAREAAGSLPCPLFLISQSGHARDRAAQVLDFLDVADRTRADVMRQLEAELFPPMIPVLDQLAEAVVSSDYHAEPPLPLPSEEARTSLPARMRESRRPLLRTHFGLPGESITPTVAGIREIAAARVVDEISLGSSDLSQRYFGKPDLFRQYKNDGGVPYATADDLVALFDATRCGNFPAIKPYSHVIDLVPFIGTCLKCGHLIGAHQAVPLFWFNELDGRGPTPVKESIREHLQAVRVLAEHGIPVEMNDPNQWSSRWAHDALIVTDYALIAAVMAQAGVRDMLIQMQVNKPSETGDYADLAKMLAGLDCIGAIRQGQSAPPAVWRETRTGIESMPPDPDQARRQLARSTLLQMLLSPDMIHLVSFCEADHAATPSDIIESSQLVRRAVRLFQLHTPDLRPFLNAPAVQDRRHHLAEEAQVVLEAIAALHPAYAKQPLSRLAPLLADPDVLHAALARGYLSAPGIVHPRYRNDTLVTAPGTHGGFDAVSLEGQPLGESDRLSMCDKRVYSHE